MGSKRVEAFVQMKVTDWEGVGIGGYQEVNTDTRSARLGRWTGQDKTADSYPLTHLLRHTH